MLSEHVRDYYLPIMKIENTDSAKMFAIEIEKIETTNTVDDSFLEAYTRLVDYIRNDVKDYTIINIHFNRMRFHIYHQFKSIANFPNLEYVSFQPNT